jgi:energy-coupling factor transporter ATP-binding protein EcfA2
MVHSERLDSPERSFKKPCILLMPERISPKDVIVFTLAQQAYPETIPVFIRGGKPPSTKYLGTKPESSPHIVCVSPSNYQNIRTRLLKSLKESGVGKNQFEWWRKITHYGQMSYFPTNPGKFNPRTTLQRYGYSPHLFDQIMLRILGQSNSPRALNSASEWIQQQATVLTPINEILPAEYETQNCLANARTEKQETRFQDTIEITIPTFGTKEPGALPTGEITLSVANLIEYLKGETIVVAVGGPPGSGKSTLAASLEACLRKIKPDNQININALDLDLGTPTLNLIRQGQGQNKELHHQSKTDWNLKLAFQALEFLEQKIEVTQKTNGGVILDVILADLPGIPDFLQQIIASRADAFIFITRDWEQIQIWRNSSRVTTTPVIAEIMSRKHEEGLDSTTRIVRLKKPPRRDFISGRISGLQRIPKTDDPFIRLFSKILLHHTLPGLVLARRHEEAKWFRIVKRVYGIE